MPLLWADNSTLDAIFQRLDSMRGDIRRIQFDIDKIKAAIRLTTYNQKLIDEIYAIEIGDTRKIDEALKQPSNSPLEPRRDGIPTPTTRR